MIFGLAIDPLKTQSLISCFSNKVIFLRDRGVLVSLLNAVPRQLHIAPCEWRLFVSNELSERTASAIARVQSTMLDSPT